MRAYLDPLDGLERQLLEYKGFAARAPRLIQTNRERRWEEISSRPDATGDEEIGDVYEEESGPEDGYGLADFARVTY